MVAAKAERTPCDFSSGERRKKSQMGIPDATPILPRSTWGSRRNMAEKSSFSGPPNRRETIDHSTRLEKNDEPHLGVYGQKKKSKKRPRKTTVSEGSMNRFFLETPKGWRKT